MKIGLMNSLIMHDGCDEEEIKELTLRVTFNPSGMPYLRDEVLNSLRECLDPSEIIAVGPSFDNSKWVITVKSKDVAVRVMSNPPTVRGNTARVTALGSQLTNVRVHWLPIHLPMSMLVVNLSEYGVVREVSFDKSKIEGFTHVLTSVRNIVMELDPEKEMPPILNLAYNGQRHRALVTIPGRGPVCFRCNGKGHTRVNCDVDFCRHCKVFGHSSEACSVSNTYAARVTAQEKVIVPVNTLQNSPECAPASGEEDNGDTSLVIDSAGSDGVCEGGSDVDDALLFRVAEEESQKREAGNCSDSDVSGGDKPRKKKSKTSKKKQKSKDIKVV
jgi:hypothetical protein